MGLTLLAITLGAALGALARWGLGLALNHLFPAVPPGTLAANLVGAYLVGLALPMLLVQPEAHPAWRLFVLTGFLGGLTTFSAFSGEVALLLQQGRLALSAGAITLHVGGSLALTLAGFATVAAWQRATG
jgi:fluoride exporter